MIRAASLRGFAALVTGLGGDPDELLDRFDIPREALASDDGLVPITAHDLMLDVAARELRCPDLGLRLVDHQDLSILGPLAVAIEASSTVAEALDCASRFLFVHSPALRIGIEPDPRGRREVIALTYRKDLRDSPYSPQAMELGLGLFHHVALALIGSSAGVRSVELPHAPQSPVQRYLDFFGTDVKFGAAQGAIRVERRLLDRQFEGANEAIRQLALDHLTSRHTDPEQRVTTHVRRALAETIGTTRPALGNVARLLAVHPRTLQRRLADESTTFEEVLDEVRRDLALRHVTTTDLPLAQIAAMSGFASQTGLSHAVRRWAGTSPRELRRAARAASGKPSKLSR
ncbi:MULTISPECIES: AraC family transcriptional regulator [unclassified Nocardioides]|uniref:AraC family transcriptional regulator n=1 Tax=unclassified Nocardioides TaxID=2615069 RepID=UPI0006F61F12|nr:MULTISPECIES: AraC family transcriptional regulator [unclassified Nocardioides]KQY57710.1 transcriptional regulator [Nocardioides sp. Root140]KRF13243.1 transcriptional regulator [Nocardioides sp. Soil796]